MKEIEVIRDSLNSDTYFKAVRDIEELLNEDGFGKAKFYEMIRGIEKLKESEEN